MIAIEARALAKSFGGRRACWDVSFSVAAGEVFGLLGPNGAGKTTTLRILAGLLAPDSGSATVAGQEVLPGSPGGPALRRRIGLLTESPGFYDRLTALENLVVFGRLQGLTAADSQSRARKLLDRFALRSHAERPFAVLSRGMKQKLAIARALLHEPAVIFLDEPTVGLDPEATREVRAVIGELAAEKRTIVLCTHHLDEVERLCARAAFIAGRLLAIHDLTAPHHARLRVTLAAAHPAAEAALQRLPALASVRAEGRVLRVELAVDAPLPLNGGLDNGAIAANTPNAAADRASGAAEAAASVVAALVACGARVASVVPEGNPLEEAWLVLQKQARAEGLVG